MNCKRVSARPRSIATIKYTRELTSCNPIADLALAAATLLGQGMVQVCLNTNKQMPGAAYGYPMMYELAVRHRSCAHAQP